MTAGDNHRARWDFFVSYTQADRAWAEWIAWILRGLGDAAGARPLAGRALAVTEAAYGPGHPHVAARLNNLAAILQDLGDTAGAELLEERALASTQAR